MISHVWILLLQLIEITTAFNLGLTQTYYRNGDNVDLLINKVESDSTQLPYSYYDLPFICPPTPNSKPLHLSLGEILKGDRIWESDYHLKFGKDEPCLRLCDRITKPHGIKRADELIRKGYVVQWLVDGLPGATTFVSTNLNSKYYAAGFPLGFIENGKSYLYNHVMLVIRFHKESNGLNSIVGFEVYPRSVINEQCPGASKDFENFALNLNVNENVIIPFTYSVYWREDNSIEYKDRWDLYYNQEINHKNIHWLSVINAVVLLVLLSTIVAVVLLRTLSKDIQSFNQQDYENLPISLESGWKLLINDVFKTPRRPLLLSIIASSGVQLLLTILGVIIICAFGIIDNNISGSVFSVALFLFVLAGFAAGYFGVLFYKNFNNTLNQDLPHCLKFSLIFGGSLTGSVLMFVLILNFFIWAKDSSNALPFGTVCVLLLLLFVFQLPLSVVGGFIANKHKFSKDNFLISNTQVEKNTTRRIPKQPMFTRYLYSIPIFGIIPFGIVYVELLFIFNSIWLEKTTFYYMYGFLLITAFILLMIIAESTIVAIYLSLIYEDYKWQWRSFVIGSSVAWFIFAYSIYYFIKILKVVDLLSVLLYFAYSGLICLLFGLACGCVGLITALVFVKKIYGAIKVD